MGSRAAVGRLGQGPELAAEEAIAIYEVGDGSPAAMSEVCRLARPSDAEGTLASLAWDRIGGTKGDQIGSSCSSSSSSSSSPTCLASGGGGGQVYLWDVRAPQQPTGPPLENGCAGPVRCLALSGHLLVAGRDPGPMLNVWDLRTRRIVQRLRGHANNDALALQINASSGRLAAGGRMGGELRVWTLW
jgi:WD40 repeat protein